VIVPYPHSRDDVPFASKPPSKSNYLRLVRLRVRRGIGGA
jgi:hypothetical protein